MQFVLTDEQVLIQDTARSFFTEHATSAAVRRTVEDEAGYDSALWRTLAVEMGFAGIAVPSRYGGSGLGQVEQSILMMEMGRRLHPSPYLSSICMAAQAILAAGTEEQKARHLPSLASGGTIAALAHMGASGASGSSAVLSPGSDGFHLSGTAGFVPFGHVADLFVVAAHGPGEGISLILVDRGMPGLVVERHASLDRTRPLSTLRFDDIAIEEALLLDTPGVAAAALSRTLDLARVSVAAEQAGGAEAVLDMTVAYSKDRIQFGRPIGSFQALKHRMADMMVEVETAKTAAWYAASTADEGGDLAEAAAVAKAYCSDAYSSCAGHAIQLHGGIGFTWEHDAHLYFKRARATSALLGSPSELRESLACRLGLGESL